MLLGWRPSLLSWSSSLVGGRPSQVVDESGFPGLPDYRTDGRSGED